MGKPSFVIHLIKTSFYTYYTYNLCVYQIRYTPNKLSIILEDKQLDITDKRCEKLYKEYEAILASIENHEEIDYTKYKLDNFEKNGY